MKLWKCTVCGQVFEGEEPPFPCSVCGAGKEAFVEVKSSDTSGAFRLDTTDKFVLIGGGVAALSAAKAIRKRNKTAKITMICGEGIIPYNRPALSDAVADGLSFENLALEEYSYFAQHEINLITDASATFINKASKIVGLNNGEKLEYTKLLLATGANPFVPIPVKENALPVKTLRNYSDVDYLLTNAKNKNVVVVGGGILGIEAALSLYERGCKITIVELGERLMPIQADDYAANILQDSLQKLGFTIYTGTSITDVTQNAAILANGKEIKADLILACVGVRSEVSLAREAGLLVNRGIVIGSDMRTDDDDIFAAGDCAELNGKVSGLYSAAAQGGDIAGGVMAQEELNFIPTVPATAFSGGGITLFSAGNLNPDDASSLVFTGENGDYKKLLFKNNMLIGAIVLGANSRAADIINALNEKMPYEKAKSLL